MDTHVHVCVDDDDPALPDYRRVMDTAGRDGDVLETGPRKDLCPWTDLIGVRRAGEYGFLASFGDDMVPRTPGWDLLLTRGIADMGGTGITYPWDGIREDIPEAPVISSDIVQALGWMCLPGLEHFYWDDVTGDLGRLAGCIRHLRAVRVDHLHPATGNAPGDATYDAARRKIEADRAAYYAWRQGRMTADVETVIRFRESKLKAA